MKKLLAYLLSMLLVLSVSVTTTSCESEEEKARKERVTDAKRELETTQRMLDETEKGWEIIRKNKK